ncbi:12980_t:CDS:2 [Ambispora gerdemannii]|uniref:12980_t:CDS:1 n=1 Tax=Ambispora gerdemannii TaxID=144530 RepID=A0A9N9GLM7_9GLOM|nr:12980_t:CDS:2 [Ambispora gerdemannii]
MAFVCASLPSIIGYSLGVLYPIGIIYSWTAIDPDSMSEFPRMKKYTIDVISIFLMVGSGFSLIPLAFLNGYNVDIGNSQLKKKFSTISASTHIKNIQKDEELQRNSSKLKGVKSVSKNLTKVVVILSILLLSQLIMAFASLSNDHFRQRKPNKWLQLFKFFFYHLLPPGTAALCQIIINFNVMKFGKLNNSNVFHCAVSSSSSYSPDVKALAMLTLKIVTEDNDNRETTK